MPDDVTINKAATIERCIKRIGDEYAGNDDHLYRDQTRQDAIVLNLQRACEAAIDLAMHLVAIHRLGVPQESREAFDLLAAAQLIDPGLSERLKRMVGFRNVAMRDYQALALPIVKSIITGRLGDFLEFTRTALRLAT
jgi:uncharacterized protein YutE (UPF0331/DUF86 family)